MDLNKLIVQSKTTELEYPGLHGFKVQVAYVTREELLKLKKKATTTKMSRRSRQPEEEVDNDLFQDLYIEAVIKGWSGLKYSYLPKLVPVDLGGVEDDDELEYSHNNALSLMKNSPDFDGFISDAVSDLENFSQSS